MTDIPRPSETYSHGRPVRLDPWQNIVSASWSGFFVGFLQLYRSRDLATNSASGIQDGFALAYRLVTDLTAEDPTELSAGTAVTEPANNWVGGRFIPGLTPNGSGEATVSYSDTDTNVPLSGTLIEVDPEAVPNYEVFPTHTDNPSLDLELVRVNVHNVFNMKMLKDAVAAYNASVAAANRIDEVEFEFEVSIERIWGDPALHLNGDQPQTGVVKLMFETRKGNHFVGDIPADLHSGDDPNIEFYGIHNGSPVQEKITSPGMAYTASPGNPVPADVPIHENNVSANLATRVPFPVHLFINVNTGLCRFD